MFKKIAPRRSAFITDRRAVNTTNGLYGSPEHHAWSNMIQRCENTECPAFGWYGARGIRICDRWRLSFDDFYADMGPRPDGHSLERIDNDGSYCPANCKWATKKEQQQNRRPKGECQYNRVDLDGFSVIVDWDLLVADYHSDLTTIPELLPTRGRGAL